MLWQRARTVFGASIIQQTFIDTTEPVFGSFDRLVPGSPFAVVERLNASLAVAALEDGVPLLDVSRTTARDGRDAWFSVARWLHAKQEIALQAGPIYGELVARSVAAQRGLSKKCLVLDLDNTLWGGVIGDDGFEGIVLGDGSPAGEAHAALQRYAKQLTERGVVLAVCSKNDHAIAAAAIDEHPEMILRMADFAAFQANWNDKAENLRLIAEQLNIGIDSLVFVDDNPAERARIRQALPMISVPELPEDIADYVRCIAEAGYFEAVSFTPEDRQRAGQYAANAARDTFRGSIQSMEEFLRGLDMTLAYGAFAPVDLPRITQLINKTNQFNITGKRYTAERIAALSADDTVLTLQFRLADRFGDNGLVSVMILQSPPGAAAVFELDTWVMSCRVFGRELELEAMNIAVEAARQRGAERIRAAFVPTAKNAVIKGLFAQLGFSERRRHVAEGQPGRWELTLADYVPRTTTIKRRKPT
jgi:FkbH-like protein